MTRDMADELLANAIREHAVAYEMTDPNVELLASYGVIVHWQPIEADGNSRYTVAYETPSVSTHTAVGLFTLAVDFAKGGSDDV